MNAQVMGSMKLLGDRWEIYLNDGRIIKVALDGTTIINKEDFDEEELLVMSWVLV